MTAPPAVDPMVQIAEAIKQMSDLHIRSATPRVRAINCKLYKCGDDWDHYSVYFRENIRAAYGYSHTDDGLDAACCSWIGSKLEAGHTLTAYERLPNAVKDNWARLNSALSRLYVNEEEKQKFLATPGGFKKGDQTLLVYKNELERRVDLYQPDLHTVPVEYQRQLVDRFIGGLEDAELQYKIRLECQREKMTITHAYNYAVDHESATVETKVKQLASAASASVLSASAPNPVANKPVVAPNVLSAYSAFPNANPASSSQSSSSSSAPMRVLERSVDPKVKANEIAIESLKASVAEVKDSQEILRKEMNERMDKLEFLMTATQTIRNQSHTAPAPRPQFQPRMAPRQFRQPYGVVPGVTGGPGYRVNPRYNPNYQLRPPSTELQTASTSANDTAQPVAAAAVAKAPSGPSISAMAAPVPETNAPAPQPIQYGPPMHPVYDAHQQAFPYPNDFWADHLEYDAAPVGYQEGAGTYSYYPQYFH